VLEHFILFYAESDDALRASMAGFDDPSIVLNYFQRKAGDLLNFLPSILEPVG
jgi:hypothetical protein